MESFETGKRSPVVVKKIIVLAIILVIAVAAVIFVRHYFYVLDSYYYTAEFHLLFMKNNLAKSNLKLFADYFRSMQTVEKIFPALLASYFIQNYWVPFSKPILVAAAVIALGDTKGLILSYVSFFLSGIICFAIGIFSLGDIFPLFQKKASWINRITAKKEAIGGLFTILFALPFLAISIPATVSAVFRMPFKRVLFVMSIGFIIRLIWLFSRPGTFV